MKTVHAIDLFAGAGGTSTGLALACKELGKGVKLTAINHWKEAVETHAANHPWARHICQDIRTVDPLEVEPDRHVDILIASPECTWHSRAAGGRPRLDQNRASAWDTLRYLELLDVENVLLENVPELTGWGPRDKNGYVIKSKKGEIYQAFLHVLRTFGYNVDTRVLNAADYGAPTSRSRLFVVAKKGNRPIVWPEPTHGRNGIGRRRWKAAREIIDWSIPGKSIYGRKRPLSPNTLRRIYEGLRRFGGEPVITLMEQSGRGGPMVKRIGDPLPTITTAKGGSMGLAEFILSQGSGGAPHSLDDPVVTIPARGAHSFIQPFIIPFHGESGGQTPRTHSTDEPVPTIASSETLALVRPFLLPVRGVHGGNTPKSIDDPLGTITQRGYGGIVDAYLVEYYGSPRSHPQSIEEPLGTITSKDRFGLVEPFIVRFNGTTEEKIRNSHRDIEEPLPTVTGSTHYGLAKPEERDGYLLDIKFRMLQPHELSAAMGFPKGYKFVGNKQEVVKQIGNAVVVHVAKSLCLSLLKPAQSPLRTSSAGVYGLTVGSP